MPRVITPTPLIQLTSWTPPTWTAEVNTDGDLIECSRTLGVVPPCTGIGEAITVSLVQRDEVRATSQHIDVVRHPVTVLVGGVSLTPADTDALAKLLTNATELTRRDAATATAAGLARQN
jgi:hypothetical protein